MPASTIATPPSSERTRSGSALRADFPVILDACVLAEAAVSDLILRLSEEPRLLLPRWTEEIWAEARRTLTGKLGWPDELAIKRMETAIATFPEAMVTGYEPFVERCENHPDDRHVLAAAIRSETETIVTFNVRDFKPEALDPWGVSASRPAEYLRVLYDHDPAVVTNALHAMAAKAERSVPELLARLAWHVGAFSNYVASAQGLDVPVMPPADWRCP